MHLFAELSISKAVGPIQTWRSSRYGSGRIESSGSRKDEMGTLHRLLEHDVYQAPIINHRIPGTVFLLYR